MAQARAAAYRGETERAFAAYHAAALRDPALLEAWEGAVRHAPGAAERDRLHRDLVRVIATADDGSALPYQTLDVLLETESGRREQALYDLARTQPESVLRGWPWAGLGITFHERGNREAALDALERALELTPDLPLAERVRARCLMELDRADEAIYPLERYLEARPRDPRALYNLAWILLNVRGEPRYARSILQRARAVLPRDPAVLIALGTAALMEAPPDTDAAGDALTAALAAAPEDPHVHWNLGVLYADHLDRPERAIEHFESYLEHGGTSSGRVTRWIEELRERVRSR